MADKHSDRFYSAFLTTEGNDGPRVPISAERIVIVLGEDAETGLPLELSIPLEKLDGQRISICAIKEPTPPVFEPGLLFPDLIVEEAPAINVRSVTVKYSVLADPKDEPPI
jgi:hypothetical protein